MEANLSFEKKSSRAPLTEGCCRLAFPCMRPSAGTAPFCTSSRQTWISARPLYSVVQLLICSRPFQSKNSNVRGGGGGGEAAGRGEAKGEERKNGGTEGKCRRDKHASSLRSKEVVNREQDMTALWLGSKRGWPVWLCWSPYVWLLDEQQGKHARRIVEDARRRVSSRVCFFLLDHVMWCFSEYFTRKVAFYSWCHRN